MGFTPLPFVGGPPATFASVLAEHLSAEWIDTKRYGVYTDLEVFADLLEEELKPGGLQGWKAAVRKAALAARGWVLVGYDLNDGSIFNYVLDSQNLWAVYNMVPVLAIDVYEHAYVRDFGATPDGRGEYVEAFFANLDWDHVNRQLAQAEAAKQGADSSATEGAVA